MPTVSGKALLNRLLSSTTKAELLILFHKNPGLIDTVEGIARRIGKKRADVKRDLNDLIALGILSRKRLGRDEAISLNGEKDKMIQDRVAAHLRDLGSAPE
jgi:DNA-binding MarR family transcriptional regulator